MKPERLKFILNELESMTVDGYDKEIGHQRADDFLREVALDDSLSESERREVVDLYDQIDKWFA